MRGVAVDKMEFPPSKTQKKYLLVFQDSFTRSIEVKPQKEHKEEEERVKREREEEEDSEMREHEEKERAKGA